MSEECKNEKVYFENYVAIDNINNSDRVLFVKNLVTDKIYVQKIIPLYQKEIYEYLIANPIPNTVKVYSLVDEKDFLVALCEYIDGDALTDYINNIFLQKEDLKDNGTKSNKSNSVIKNFYKHIYTLLDIIQHLQKSKIIIHRDIKPDNIIITKNDDLYLIDFDTAKVYEGNETKDTHLLGSEGYAAPEQYGFGSSNKSTDIYAIGKVMNDYIDIIDDEKLTKKILPIIDRCCKIDFKDRYQSIGHVKSDLFRAEHNIMFLAIPGFRSNKSFHIVIASFFYIFLIYTCFFNTYININSLNACIFLSALSFVFVFFNYLNVHRFLPFAKSKNLALRYLSILVYSLIIPTILIASFIFFYK